MPMLKLTESGLVDRIKVFHDHRLLERVVQKGTNTMVVKTKIDTAVKHSSVSVHSLNKSVLRGFALAGVHPEQKHAPHQCGVQAAT